METGSTVPDADPGQDPIPACSGLKASRSSSTGTHQGTTPSTPWSRRPVHPLHSGMMSLIGQCEMLTVQVKLLELYFCDQPPEIAYHCPIDSPLIFAYRVGYKVKIASNNPQTHVKITDVT